MKNILYPFRRWGAVLVLCSFCYAGQGCSSYMNIESNPDFSPGIQQSDIPVPRNFRFDKNRSVAYIRYSRGVGNFRCWTGYYYGDQQVGNLINWYKDQMAVDGWSHKNIEDGLEIQANTSFGSERGRFPSWGENLSKRWLTFVKRDETATITLFRDFDSHKNRYMTVVKAEIFPTPIKDLTPDEATGPSDDILFPDLLEARRGERESGTSLSPRLIPGDQRSSLEARPIPVSHYPSDNSRGLSSREVLDSNKPVVKEEIGPENNEGDLFGEQLIPDDGE